MLLNRRYKAIVLALSAFFLSTLYPHTINAETLNINSFSDFDSGSYVNIKKNEFGVGINLESYGSWNALSWKTPDKTLTIGAALTSDDNYIYVIRGSADNLFWKYSPTEDKWYTLANLPGGAYYGSELQNLNNHIYALLGGYQKTFARYSKVNNEWEVLRDFPELVYQGASLTTDGTYIYALASNNSQGFYRYNINDNTWASLSAIPVPPRAGSDLVRVGGYIYTPRGNNTNTFYRYNISTNSWDTRANLPVLINEEEEITTDGTSIFFARLTNTTEFYKYDISSNTWSAITPAPLTSRYIGVEHFSKDGYIYFFRGNNDYRFWKYDITANQFIGPNEAPATLATGSDMVYYNGDVYTTRGTNTNTFYKYNVATNTWSTLANSLYNFNDYTRGEVANGEIYFLLNNNTSIFLKYNPISNTWTELTTTPATVRYSGSLAYPGSGDYIYAIRANGTGTFWRYKISTNAWETTISSLPTGIIGHYGSTLTAIGNNVYFTAGYGIKRFFKYDITLDSWSELAQLPFSTYAGTDLTYNGSGKFLAISGYYRDEFWEYTIADNAWRKLKSIPTYRALEIGAYNGASIVYVGSNTYILTRGNTTQEIFTYQEGLTNYESSGNWTSGTIDLNYVSSWNSITLNETKPLDSDILVQTRTSNDLDIWSDWESIALNNIVSPNRRYVQFKVTLLASSDLSKTPILNSISIDYTSDNQNPSQPSNIKGYSKEIGGIEITSMGTYEYTNPYFTWDSSIDNETSIKGYYVYFGKTVNANPVEQGSFQTNNNYAVTTPIEIGLNYLRIVAEDIIGNKSEAIEAYIYNYQGIAPIHSININNSEFNGIHNNTQVNLNTIKLENLTQGYWKEQRLTNSTVNLGYGAKNMAYISSSNKIYVFPGMNNGQFYEYDVNSDVWTRLADAPGNVYYGGGAIEGPTGYIYALAGGNATGFWRYNISTNTWDNTIPGAPLTVGYGGSLVYDGSQYIYALRGNNTDFFWRYDTSTDIWESLSRAEFGAPVNAINNNVYIGGNLTIDTENDLIYAIQGGSFHGFAVYDINRDSWTTLPNLPSLPSYGATITYYPLNNTIYYQGGNYLPYHYKYDIAEEEWSELNQLPIGFYYGASQRIIDEYIYTIRGGNTSNIYKYDIEKDSWHIPTRGLFGRVYEGTNLLNAGYGADLVKGDGYNYYITRGNIADEFLRWNEKTGEITRLANTPKGMDNGGSMVYESSNNKIYLIGGTYDNAFFVYDIATNTWSEELSDKLPIIPGYGSSMVYDGSRYIYYARGSAQVNFYRFDTQGSAGTKWSNLANTPVAIGYGSELLYKDGAIYTLQGQNAVSNRFLKYTIGTNSWTDLAPLSAQVYNDGFLADGFDGYFYAARASNTVFYYRYSLALNTWEQLNNIPANIYNGGAGESNGVNMIYALTGAGSNSYQDAIYTYVIKSDNSGFELEGNYESQSHDAGSVYKWAGIRVNYVINENSNLEIQTSTSEDGINWDNYANVTKEKTIGNNHYFKINSSSNRYIKVKFNFYSGDGVYSSYISDYSIYYYQDIDEPTNPDITGLKAYSNNGGSEINTNVWYQHNSPYFTWKNAGELLGASDGSNGSGVEGYYIYFGTNSSGDPKDIGNGGSFITDNSYTPSNLIDSTTYYLRIQTKDYAGNVSEDILDAFVYKYDTTGPTSPADLSATPSGYTSTNSFSFTWSESEFNGAPVAEYCYKTLAPSGPFSVDQCIDLRNINNVTAYKVGANTFQVRAKDEAGNYSSYSSVLYYYVDYENAPAPPRNLTVFPSDVNTENNFGFSWDPPAEGTFYGSVANLSYHYSVNALPSQYSTSKTSLTYLNPGAYATLPGENTFYVVTQDEAGNINYSNYTSVSFYANTIAPGIPANVEIADVSVKHTQSWRLAISWDEPEDSGSGVSGYQIYRSINGTDYYYHSYTSGQSLVDTKLNQMIHYYKVKACDSTNNCGAFSEIVQMYPDGRFIVPAELIVEPIVSNISPKKATISWVTNRTSDSKIAYGIESGRYFDTEISNSDQVIDHNLTIPNLNPGTTYYFVTRWTDEDGNTGESEELTFETSPAPSIEEPKIKSLGLDSALIEFTTRGASRVRLFYGETSAFGGMVEIYTGSQEGKHNIEVSDLKDGTKYYYKINTFDIDGAEYEGEMHSFETLPRPKVLSQKILQISGTASTSLLVEWNVNTPVSSIVTFYPTNNPSQARDEVNVLLKSGVHRMVLLDLFPNTAYTIIIKGRDFRGNEASSGPIAFSTASDTRPPVLYDLEVTSEIIGSGTEATAQIVVSYKTDELSTSQVEYGEGTGTIYTQKSQLDTNMSQSHLVIISGLTPSKVYHLRAISKDEGGNSGYSIDKVIVTNATTEDAFDLVIKNLSSIFSFLQ